MSDQGPVNPAEVIPSTIATETGENQGDPPKSDPSDGPGNNANAVSSEPGASEVAEAHHTTPPSETNKAPDSSTKPNREPANPNAPSTSPAVSPDLGPADNANPGAGTGSSPPVDSISPSAQHAPKVPSVSAKIPRVIEPVSSVIADELNKPSTSVGRINAVWNTWLNTLADSLLVEPAAHRYDINDRMVPDIVVYAPTAGTPSWKIVYEGHPAVDDLPMSSLQPPSPAMWDERRKNIEYICSRHEDQSPSWAVVSIGSWARVYKFIDKKLIFPASFVLGGALTLVPVPEELDQQPDPKIQAYISFNISGNVKPSSNYLPIITVGLPMIFL